MLWMTLALAQDGSMGPDVWVDKSFLIVASEKTFADALGKAGRIAEQTGIRFDLRGVGFDPAHAKLLGGLTLEKAVCEDQAWEYPCYVPRGRWDAGSYLSVEYSDAVEGFTKGLYVVIAASGEKKDLEPVLQKVKTAVPDAYIKSARVYVGCMH